MIDALKAQLSKSATKHLPLLASPQPVNIGESLYLRRSSALPKAKLGPRTWSQAMTRPCSVFINSAVRA